MAGSLKVKRTPITTPPYQVPSVDITPDPPIFSLVTTFKDAKKKVSYFFLITCPQAQNFQSKKFNFVLKFFVKNLILQALFQSSQHIYEKKVRIRTSD